MLQQDSLPLLCADDGVETHALLLLSNNGNNYVYAACVFTAQQRKRKPKRAHTAIGAFTLKLEQSSIISKTLLKASCLTERH